MPGVGLLRSTAMVLVLAGGGAACAQEVDGELLTAGGGDPELRAAYIDAVADTAAEGGDDADLPLSRAGADCYGEAWVDVVGVDELVGKVTPEEIRSQPDSSPGDYGIDVSDDQGAEMVRRLIDCEPSVLRDLSEAMVDELSAGQDLPLDIDVDCLVEADQSGLEVFMGGVLAADDADDPPSADQGGAMYDWLSQCADLKAAIIASLEADEDLSPAVVACLDENITDDIVRGLFVEGVQAEIDIEDSPASAALMEAMLPCARIDQGD